MSDCNHLRIRTYRFADDGTPADFWACAECKRRFKPIDLKEERDAARYRFVRQADGVPISHQAARDPVAYDEAIDRAMAARSAT